MTLFERMSQLFRKPKPIPPPVCRASEIDGCKDNPDTKCPRGLCMVHCVCWCRGTAAHPVPQQNSSETG